MNDITAHLSGELDIEFSHPNGTLDFSTSASSINVPASLLWQVNNGAAAEQDLADLVNRVDANDTFRTATSSDGTTYHVTDKDYGYAVRGRDGPSFRSISRGHWRSSRRHQALHFPPFPLCSVPPRPARPQARSGTSTRTTSG